MVRLFTLQTSLDGLLVNRWNELVIYELHVASFNRTDAKPGDLSSIIDKLAVLKDLGINVIELMP